jgi:hypothetical protein
VAPRITAIINASNKLFPGVFRGCQGFFLGDLLRFKKGKEPDTFSSYLADKADQEKRDGLGKDGKKLTKAEREKLAKDPNYTNKRLTADEN